MADNFSLDDILAEIDAKKAMKSGETSEKEAAPKRDFSVTSIIGESELNAALKEAEDVKEKEKAVKKPKEPKKDYEGFKAQKAEKLSPLKEHKWEQNDAEEKPEKSGTKKEHGGFRPEISDKPAKGREVYSKPKKEEPSEEEEYSKPKKSRKSKDSEIYAKRPKEKPSGRMIDRIAEKIAVRVDDDDADEDNDAVIIGNEGEAEDTAFAPESKDTEKTRVLKLESKGQDKEKQEEDEEDAPVFGFKPKKPAKRPEYDTQQRKLIDRQLKAEETFEDPDELIDAINPYDVKSRVSAPAVYLGGDTQGIAGNELKRLAEEGKKPNQQEDILLKEKTVKLAGDSDKWEGEVLGNTIERTSPIKEYIPKKEKELKEKAPDPEGAKSVKPSLKEKRSNDALLEKLNLAFARRPTTVLTLTTAELSWLPAFSPTRIGCLRARQSGS